MKKLQLQKWDNAALKSATWKSTTGPPLLKNMFLLLVPTVKCLAFTIQFLKRWACEHHLWRHKRIQFLWPQHLSNALILIFDYFFFPNLAQYSTWTQGGTMKLMVRLKVSLTSQNKSEHTLLKSTGFYINIKICFTEVMQQWVWQTSEACYSHIYSHILWTVKLAPIWGGGDKLWFYVCTNFTIYINNILSESI